MLNCQIAKTVLIQMPDCLGDHPRVRVDQQPEPSRIRLHQRKPQRKPSRIAAKVDERLYGPTTQRREIRLALEQLVLDAELIQRCEPVPEIRSLQLALKRKLPQDN